MIFNVKNVRSLPDESPEHLTGRVVPRNATIKGHFSQYKPIVVFRGNSPLSLRFQSKIQNIFGICIAIRSTEPHHSDSHPYRACPHCVDDTSRNPVDSAAVVLAVRDVRQKLPVGGLHVPLQ